MALPPKKSWIEEKTIEFIKNKPDASDDEIQGFMTDRDSDYETVISEMRGAPITMTENAPTPIADALVGLNRGIESAGEAITSPIKKLFTAPPNQDIVVPEELDMSSMQAARDRQAMLPPSMPAEEGYVPPAGITESLEAALPMAYQATKKGISGAIEAAAENIPVTSFPTAPIAEYMQSVGQGAEGEMQKIIQEKQIRPGTVGSFATDVTTSMAQFLPIAGMSIISPSVAPAGLAFLATVSGGDKYQRAKEAGFGEGEALAQGIAYGAAEAIGEKIGLDYLLAAAKNPAVMSGVKSIFAQGLKQAGVEGAEEGLTQIIQNATDIVAKKVNPQTTGAAPTMLQDVPYAMGVGAAAGGVTGAGLGALQSMMGGQQQAPPQQEQAPPHESPTATEPPPQNMEETARTIIVPQEPDARLNRIQPQFEREARPEMQRQPIDQLFKRKPAVTVGEAERVAGDVPMGEGMTVTSKARPSVTFGESERRGEAIPEGKGMTVESRQTPSDMLFKREPSPQPQQAAEVVPEDITPQPAEPMAVKTPEIETTPEVGDTIQWNTPKVLGKTQTKTGMIVDKTADNRWTVSIDGQEFDFNPQKNTNIQVVEKYQQPAKTEQEQYVETRRAEIAQEQKAKIEPEIFTDEEIAKKKTYIQRLNDEFEQKQKENKERATKRILAKSFEYGDKPTENKYYRILNANENIDAKEGFEIVENAKPFKVADVPGDYFIVKEDNADYKKKSIYARFPKSKMLYSVSDGETGYKILSVPTVKEAIEKLKTIFDSGKLRKAIDDMVKSKGRSPRYNKATQPRPKSGPGMFGAGQLQNAYDKIEPTLKKGVDTLFKKGKQAYAKNMRNADPTRDKGRVIDLTEVEGKPVETDAPLRPRIGLFNLQNVYESVFGKPRQSDNRITIGDPKIGTKINDMYDRTEATRKNLDEQAEKKRPSTYATTNQSMIDVFMPYLDIVKGDSKRYEQALSKLHDVFYIPSAVEGFLLDLRDEILTPVQKAGKTYRDYSAYRMAKWTLTGRAKVKSPLSLKEAQDFIDSIDAPTKKLFEDITTNFHERVWKNVLKELELTGLKDDKTINFIMDKENYATFFPAKQMGLSYGSREYKPSGEIFKLTEEGYTGDIQDVLTSLTQKGIAMITHANINAAKLEAFDILKTYSPGDITPAKQSMKGYTKIKDSNGNEIEIPIMEFDEPAPNSQMALLTARDKGKAVGYYVPKQFATSFDEALGSGEQLNDALRYFSNATQAIKNVWIDYNPPWQLFTNIIRDIPAAMIEMPGFKKPVKFAGKVIRNAPAAIGDYIPVIGKALQIMTGYDRTKFDAQVKKMLKEKKLLSSKDVQQLGDYNISVFDRIQNAFDTFPREGESKKFLQQVKAFGKDVERLVKTAFDETLVESQEFTDDEIVNMTRRGGSPAFAVRGGGKAFNVATTGLVFYNAVKEGWRAGKYFAQKDPVGFVIKASIPLSIFSFGVAAVSGAFGDEWKKAYLAIKKSDRENKLTFPLWWEKDGQIKYIAMSVPQFLKPFMTAINEFGSADASILEGMADAFSNEMPSLNPVLDIAKSLMLYGQNKPPLDRFGNPIMTQDQWTAGGADKALNMLKSISNQNLFGSLYRFPIKPSDTQKGTLEALYDSTFGKILKTSFAPTMDTEQEEANMAKARLLMRQAIEIEKSDPAEYKRLRDEIKKLGVIPSRQFMRSVRRNLNIEREEEAGTITKREAYEKKLRSQPKAKRKKYNELFKK